jgi:hypothetical protein
MGDRPERFTVQHSPSNPQIEPVSRAAARRLRLVETDYVVVGTGSAGSVVANRLSADPRVRATVLEAGPWDKNKFIHIPAAFVPKLFRSEVDWDYLTEPQKMLNGRRIYWPRGKVLGGSSSMNAMMWVRGFAADYDEWGALAGPEWDGLRRTPQRGLLLDRNAVEDRPGLVDETVRCLDILVEPENMTLHLRKRVFVGHPARRSGREFLVLCRFQ